MTVQMNGKSVKEVISYIEKNSEFIFFYRNDAIDLNRKVTLSVQNQPIQVILDELFMHTQIRYEINDRQVTLKKEEVQQEPQTKRPQKRTIAGTVTEAATGEPLVGVSIKLKDTPGIGTITDIDGKFSIEVTNNTELIFSYVGCKTLTLLVGNQNRMDVKMQSDTELLDEVVVVGYGTQRKVDLTGSVKRVNLETVKNAPNASLTSSLQGAIPGLNIGQVNTAGGSANIQVRGQSTLNGSQNVLIVLDGIIYNGSMASINPADVESVDVLKDASSKAIYGASAANGVILITTKKGKKQSKPMINVNMTLSTQSPAKRLHPKNREEKIRSIYDYYWNQGGYTQDANGNYSVNPDFDVASKIEASQVAGYNNGTDYNWLDEGTQDSYYMNYQISLSNSTEKTNFYISGGYTKQEGWVANDSFDRKNVRINLETKVLDWLTIGTRSFGSFMNYSGASPSLHDLYLYSPMNTPYDESGEMIYIPNGTLTNPFVCFDADDRDLNNSLSALAYASIDVPYIKGLNYRFNWGNNYKWNQHYYSNVWGSNHKGNAYKNTSSTYDYTIDHILSYKTTLAEKHHLDLTAVFGLRKQTYEYTTANGEQYTDLSLSYNSLEQAVIQKIGSDAWQEQYMYQMARVNYNYADKYLITTTLRRDGFSGFSENHRYGLFPSFALGWIISNERFFHVPAID